MHDSTSWNYFLLGFTFFGSSDLPFTMVWRSLFLKGNTPLRALLGLPGKLPNAWLFLGVCLQLFGTPGYANARHKIGECIVFFAYNYCIFLNVLLCIFMSNRVFQVKMIIFEGLN